ncbi:MAG: hypothetical protein J0H06_16355, partial [Actinobacteria bacterium]|nr:hypothetical protein [Actinomycetota bacterium]
REALLSGAAALAKPALGLGSGDESSTLHGLYWLIAGIAQRGPLLLAVDDAQWGDDPSLRCLAYVANRLEDLPVTMLVAIRQGERRPIALEALLARPDTELLSPRALSPRASAQLVRDVFDPAAGASFCSSCHEASGGNPFLLRELLEQLRRDGVDGRSAAPATVRTTTPTTIARSVLSRLARLPRAARELATSVAVAGGLAPLPVLAALAGLDADAVNEAAATLTKAGVFDGLLPLAFVHPLVRDVVYGDVAPAERDHRHREAARLLAAAGAGHEQVANQLMETEPAGDPWVASRLEAAAAEAIAAGAPSTAAPLLERALREPPPRAQRVRLLAELGRAEARSDLEGVERMREAPTRTANCGSGWRPSWRAIACTRRRSSRWASKGWRWSTPIGSRRTRPGTWSG